MKDKSARLVELNYLLNEDEKTEQLQKKEEISVDKEHVGEGLLSKCISKEKENELIKMIESHENWLKSQGKEGERLVLDSENLNGFKFFDCDLRNASITNCDLTNCVFYADFGEATFQGNKISNTKWTGCDIENMKTDNITSMSIKSQLDIDKNHNSMFYRLKNKSINKELER